MASASKTKSNPLINVLDDDNSDMELDLYGLCDSDDDYVPDKRDSCREDTEFLFPQVTNIEVDVDVPMPLQTPTNDWTTEGEMKRFPCLRQNQFYENLSGGPIDYFNFFFTEEFLTMICDETNAQAVRLLLSGTATDQSRITNWKNLTIPELRVFLGIIFHMGTISLSRIPDYWKTDRLFAFPIFKEQMGRNRFLLIMRCLNFSTETNNENPIHKVRSVIDYFNKTMTTCYYPGKELVVDGCWNLHRGRWQPSQLVQNQNKHPKEIKLYMLTEPDGLTLKLHLTNEGAEQEDSDILHLLEEKLQNGHSIYMDSSYVNINLVKILLDNTTYCTGIFKQHPKELSGKTLKTKQNFSLFRDGLHMGIWKINQRVTTYISTEFEDKMVPVTGKTDHFIYKPEALAKYNEYMSGGVERHEQVLAYYPCERLTLRRYVKCAIHVFQLLMINSFKIYSKFSGQPKKTFYDYRLSVIKALLPVPTVRGKMMPKTPTDAVSTASKLVATNISHHKIAKTTEKSNGRLRRKHCRQCSRNKKRTDTVWYCSTCSNLPGLCVQCFDDYHTTVYE